MRFPFVSFRLLAGIALAGLLVAPVRAEKTIALCVEDKEVRPSRLAVGKGLNYDLLAAVGKRLGLRFEYRAMPWRRCLAELTGNRVDGAFAASFRPERREYGVYPGDGEPADASKRLHLDRYVLIRRKGGPPDWDGQRFSRLEGSIGTQFGYSVAGDLKAMGIKVDDGAPGNPELQRKLQAGYVSAIAVLEGEAAYLMAHDETLRRDFETVATPLVEKPYFLIFSHRLWKERKALATSVWDAIEAVRESRDYKAIEARATR